MPPDDLSALVDGVHADVVDRGGVSRSLVARMARARAPLAPSAVVDGVVDRVLARTVGLGPLEPLLADPEVTEVMVNGPGVVWIERRGRLHETAVHVDGSTIGMLIERIVGPLGLRPDRTSPLVDARLPDGSRVNVIVPPLAVDGACITIRRFGVRAIPLAQLCTPDVHELMRDAVEHRANVLVSGGTGAGKTTLLNALAALVPDGERIVTVEDAAELRLAGRHVVRLEARPANADGVGAVPVRALVRNALRMRPDRIVVGEVRGAEALDMLQAMNTGHEGSLSTCHANSPADALRRVETMVLMAGIDLPLAAIREQLVSALDLVVHVARQRDGSRRVVAVAEVVGGDERVRTIAGEP
jgi:pilus assembly protein CpaF